MKTRGGSARAGDVIPYVFCLKEGEDSSKTAQADRAKHPDEVKKANGELKIGELELLVRKGEKAIPLTFCFQDYDFYLSQQVLPPTERLCEPIEGTDRSRLAECLGESLFDLSTYTYANFVIPLGLDPMRFRNIGSGGSDERAFVPLDSQLSDQERFKDATPLLIQCRSCKGQLNFSPINDREVSLYHLQPKSCT